MPTFSPESSSLHRWPLTFQASPQMSPSLTTPTLVMLQRPLQPWIVEGSSSPPCPIPSIHIPWPLAETLFARVGGKRRTTAGPHLGAAGLGLACWCNLGETFQLKGLEKGLHFQQHLHASHMWPVLRGGHSSGTVFLFICASSMPSLALVSCLVSNLWDSTSLHRGSCPLAGVMENVNRLLAEVDEFSLLVIFLWPG